MSKYRIDNSFGKIYELINNSYIFLTSFYVVGITSKMSEKKQIKKIEEYIEYIERIEK